MKDREVAAEISEVLDPEDFYKTSHQKIFSAIQGLHLMGDVPDLPSIHAEMHGEISASSLAELFDYDLVVLDIQGKVEKLKSLSALRRMIEICNAGLKRCFDPNESPVDSIEWIQRKAIEVDPAGFGFGDAEQIGSMITRNVEKWEEDQGKETYVTGVPTGFYNFDYLTCGLQDSDLDILAARPSMGKTAIALNIARHAAGAGYPVAFFSLEQPKSQLFARIVSSMAKVDGQKFRSGMLEKGDWTRITDCLSKIQKMPLIIDDEGGLSFTEIRRRSRKLLRQHKIKLIIIDHLQLVTGFAKKNSNRNEDLGAATRTFKETAKELGIPVLLLCQLNRNLEHRSDKRPRLSDLRESGNIEQDADTVSFLYRPEVYSDNSHESLFPGYTEFYLGKQRNGPLGMLTLRFENKFATFQNVSSEEYPIGE